MHVMFATILGVVVGFLVQVLIANYFGAGKEVDSFVIATTIPEFVYGLTNAVLMTSLVIILVQYKVRHRQKEMQECISNIFNIAFIFLAAIATLVYFLAPLLSGLLAPGFDSEEIALTTKLIKLLSVTIFFYGLSSFTTGVLYARKCFFVASLFKAFIGIMIIAAILLFWSTFGIFALAIGAVLGTGIGFLSQIILLFRVGWKYHPLVSVSHPAFKSLISLAFPLAFASFLFYLNKFAGHIIASTINEGAIAILNYAFLIVSLPAIFLSGSLSTTIFPLFAEYFAQRDMEHFKILFAKALKVVALVLIPTTLFFIILGRNIIKILFERGMFTEAASSSTYLALSFYSIGLLAYGFNFVLCAAFYAIKQMKIIVLLNSLLLFINTTLSLILIDKYSFIGLAFAMSLAYIITTIIALFVLKRSIGGFYETDIMVTLLKLVFASFCMGVYFLIANEFTNLLRLDAFFSIIFLFGSAVLLYIFIIKIMGVKEIAYFLRYLNILKSA